MITPETHTGAPRRYVTEWPKGMQVLLWLNIIEWFIPRLFVAASQRRVNEFFNHRTFFEDAHESMYFPDLVFKRIFHRG